MNALWLRFWAWVLHLFHKGPPPPPQTWDGSSWDA